MTGSSVTPMSGHAYVSAVFHGEEITRETLKRIPTASARNCDHVTHICDTREVPRNTDAPTLNDVYGKPGCLDSWAQDYDLLLYRTHGGRRMIQVLNMGTPPQRYNTRSPLNDGGLTQ